MQTLILASQSKRRAELLQKVGFPIQIVPSAADEDYDETHPFGQIVISIAQKKALEVARRVDGIILAADTVVVCDRVILGKPGGRDEAFSMLSLLSGACHEVYTGVFIKRGEKQAAFYEMTRVWFKKLSDSEIEGYIRTKEPFDKAGGYGIQEMGAMFVERIEGDYFNVVGLPLCRTCRVLKEEFDMSVL